GAPLLRPRAQERSGAHPVLRLHPDAGLFCGARQRGRGLPAALADPDLPVPVRRGGAAPQAGAAAGAAGPGGRGNVRGTGGGRRSTAARTPTALARAGADELAESGAMCGIFGQVGAPLGGDALAAVRRVLRHRGPESDGVHAAEGVTLVHTRLRILDLS